MGEPEPSVTPVLLAKRGDVQQGIGLEDLAVRELASQRLGDSGLAGSAGAGDQEQRERGHLLLVAAARAAQYWRAADLCRDGRGGRAAVHAEDFLRRLGDTHPVGHAGDPAGARTACRPRARRRETPTSADLDRILASISRHHLDDGTRRFTKVAADQGRKIYLEVPPR